MTEVESMIPKNKKEDEHYFWTNEFEQDKCWAIPGRDLKDGVVELKKSTKGVFICLDIAMACLSRHNADIAAYFARQYVAEAVNKANSRHSCGTFTGAGFVLHK